MGGQVKWLLFGQTLRRCRRRSVADQQRVHLRDGDAALLPDGLAGGLCPGEEAVCRQGLGLSLFVCAMALPKQVILIPLVTLAKHWACPNPCGR
jgi:hypothetical protein